MPGLEADSSRLRTIDVETPVITNGTTHNNELEVLCRQLKTRVDNFLNTPTSDPLLKSVKSQVVVSLGVIEEALQRYRPEELSLSYNGGKDCLVLLILILASLSSSSSLKSSLPASASHTHSAAASHPFPRRLQALYIQPPLPFAEVDAFVEETSSTYHLDLTTSSEAMKPALTSYLREHASIRAVFVGTRRTDPHGAQLTFFDETDSDWPSFMRIHPVIDWHYREVWAFIRALRIPYCSLYDKGYTSLGGTDDTHPNPALRRGRGANQDADGQPFRPAYELLEDREERLGRDR
ncbi:putative FAD synthetase [Durotheca rogersii]|uniref:putative FAD synthetase n=1 Tax=Durotheca rogersii TaxID=419775 RepID=UPI002220BBF5|nr:putative FAD synthetase [Durotheca rogersii]KAI5861974.1 putative FAD synthetase [Durotheca rogersii]